MATNDILQTFLQIHLASDSSSVIHLPFILQNLNVQILENSGHRSKWNARISSLIHSRESGARWAGLCIARQCAVLSKSFIAQSGQGWVSVVLPMLSKKESVPVLAASIRLLLHIFTCAITLPEFHRQVTTPNVPNFTKALIQLCQRQTDEDMHLLCTNSITTLIVAHPNLHRPLIASLSAFTNDCINSICSSSRPLPEKLVDSISHLSAVLHLCGGKTGAAGVWRKNVDEAVASCYFALGQLNSTYADGGQNATQEPVDPLEIVSIHLKRLRCSIGLLCALLNTDAPRPVPVPISAVIELSIEMLKSPPGTNKNVIHPYDGTRRTLENAARFHILSYACELVMSLSACVRQHLAPHITRLLTIIVFHLEQSSSTDCLPITRLLPVLLKRSYASSEAPLVGRILKALLSIITVLLSPVEALSSSKITSNSTPQLASGGTAPGNSKRINENEDVLDGTRVSFHLSTYEREVVLSTLDAIPCLLCTPGLPSYLLSLTSRVLLALSLTLPVVRLSGSPADAWTRDEIVARIRRLCAEGAALVESGRGLLARTLPIIAWNVSSSSTGGKDDYSLLLDLMLHPRLPPLLREVSPVEVLAMLRGEEGSNERETREALRVGVNSPSELDKAYSTMDIDKVTPANNEKLDTGLSGPSTRPITAGRPENSPAVSLSVGTTNAPGESGPSTQPLLSTPVNVQYPSVPLSQSIKVAPLAHQVRVVPPVKQSDVAPPTTSIQAASKEWSNMNDLMTVDDSDEDGGIPPVNIESDTDED